MIQLINITKEELSEMIEKAVEKVLFNNTDENAIYVIDVLNSEIELNELSPRIANSLRSKGILYYKDLVKLGKSEIIKFENIGKKGVTEIEELVESKGLTFYMNLKQYL